LFDEIVALLEERKTEVPRLMTNPAHIIM